MEATGGGHGVWRLSDGIVASRSGKECRVRDMHNGSEGKHMQLLIL
jgi:hypothetical protein